MIINTDSRQRARERERQNDAHGIVYALAERTNCTCEENHLKEPSKGVNGWSYNVPNIRRYNSIYKEIHTKQNVYDKLYYFRNYILSECTLYLTSK